MTSLLITFLERNDSTVHHGKFETWEKRCSGFLFDDVLPTSRSLTFEFVKSHQRLRSGIRVDPRPEPRHPAKKNIELTLP